MASAEPSDTECPVCFQDYRTPKLLPCSHSFCLECLETLAANRTKIKCPECRREEPVPRRGVTAFPDNKALNVLLKLKNTFKCLKHGLPLHFFCEKCQEQICSSCTAVKHKAHDVKEIEDKAEACKNDMSNTRAHIREISLELGTHLDQINQSIDMVQNNTTKTVEAIEKRKMEIDKKIQEMKEKVYVEIERQTNKVLEQQEENIAKLQKAKEETLTAKYSFDEMYVDVDRGLANLSNNEIVQKRGIIQRSLEESKVRLLVNNKFDVEINNIQFKGSDWKPHFKNHDVGMLGDYSSFIRQPAKIQSEFVKFLNIVPKALEIKTFDPQLEKWSYTKMCVIRDGHIIISGKVQHDNLLKCFDVNGNCLWKIKIGEVGENTIVAFGICHLPNRTEYFILTRRLSIELRRVKDGAVVRKRDVEFTGTHACATEGAVLVVNLRSEPRKLVQLSVKPDSDECFEKTNVTIDTKLNNVLGLHVLNLNRREMVIVTWKENTIEAIDTQTGEIMWKISEEYEGKKLEPCGVCQDDIGNLYIADRTNYRVLVVSPDGAVKQKLIDTPAGTFWIGWLDSQRLVIDYEDDKEHVKIYKIDYVEKDS